MIGNLNTQGPARSKEKNTKCRGFKKLDYAVREGTQKKKCYFKMEVNATNAEGKEPTVPVKDKARGIERARPILEKQRSLEQVKLK